LRIGDWLKTVVGWRERIEIEVADLLATDVRHQTMHTSIDNTTTTATTTPTYMTILLSSVEQQQQQHKQASRSAK